MTARSPDAVILEAVLEAIPAEVLLVRDGRVLLANGPARAALERDVAWAEIAAALRGDGDRYEAVPLAHAPGRCLLLVGHSPAAAWDGALASVAGAGALTPREREVLSHLARGRSNAEIASELGRSESTVEVHVSRVLKKLRCTSRTEALARVMSVRTAALHASGRAGPPGLTSSAVKG